MSQTQAQNKEKSTPLAEISTTVEEITTEYNSNGRPRGKHKKSKGGPKTEENSTKEYSKDIQSKFISKEKVQNQNQARDSGDNWKLREGFPGPGSQDKSRNLDSNGKSKNQLQKTSRGPQGRSNSSRNNGQQQERTRGPGPEEKRGPGSQDKSRNLNSNEKNQLQKSQKTSRGPQGRSNSSRNNGQQHERTRGPGPEEKRSNLNSNNGRAKGQEDKSKGQGSKENSRNFDSNGKQKGQQRERKGGQASQEKSRNIDPNVKSRGKQQGRSRAPQPLDNINAKGWGLYESQQQETSRGNKINGHQNQNMQGENNKLKFPNHSTVQVGHKTNHIPRGTVVYEKSKVEPWSWGAIGVIGQHPHDEQWKNIQYPHPTEGLRLQQQCPPLTSINPCEGGPAPALPHDILKDLKNGINQNQDVQTNMKDQGLKNNNFKTWVPTSVIGFLDIDAFECQVYQRLQPQFKNMPCVVATSSGRILAATYEAKALGVSRSKTPRVKDAQAKCPSVHVFWKQDKWDKQDNTMTRLATWQISTCIKKFCEQFGHDIVIEVASSDEVYLDISAEVTRGMEKRKKSSMAYAPMQISEHIVWEQKKQTVTGPFLYYMTEWVGSRNAKYYRGQVNERLIFGALFLSKLRDYLEMHTGLSSSGGVGSNKLLAKIGCGLNKPAKITICPPESVLRISKIVSVGDIPGLGGVIGTKLMETFDITTIGEILGKDYEKLEEAFGVDKTKEIISWAQGIDSQPVENCNYSSKDLIKCNKSMPDINNAKQLLRALTNLREEAVTLLEEEKFRNRRTTDQIRVEFVFEKDLRGRMGQDFETNTPELIYKLPQAAFQFINSSGDLTIKFKITDLCFVLKKFYSVDSSDANSNLIDQLLESELQNLSLDGVSKTLKVTTNSELTDVPKFHHKNLGSFRTLFGAIGYTSDPKQTQIPKLLSTIALDKLKGIYVGTDNCRNILILDHVKYCEWKHKCFVKWLKEEYKKMEVAKPDFVAFSGRIADCMKTNLNKKHGEWSIFAMNFNDVIYIWDEKSPIAQDTLNPIASCGLFFERAVVSPGGIVSEINEYDMIYSVNDVTFGKHKLLLVTQMDAETENGEWAQVSLFRQKYNGYNKAFGCFRKLKLWSQVVTTGATKVVLGYRSDGLILQDIVQLTTEEYTESLGGDADFSSCYDFEHRLLDWIKRHLPTSDPQIVKKFSWSQSKLKYVYSEQVPREEVRNLVVPRLYGSYFYGD